MSDSPMYDTMTGAKGPMTGLSTPSGPPLISLALDQTRAAVENLRDEVYQIIEKIQPVMGPDMTADSSKSGGLDSQPVSSVTDLINGIGTDIATLSRTIRSARQRVEL